MWNARTKRDLIIEVWEKLDCENVGSPEIKAIAIVVADQYGPAAVDSPMTIARLLADEGAQLRHAEIMRLHLERLNDSPYDAAFRNIIKIDDLNNAARSIRDLENLRQKYALEQDKEGLRLVRETAIKGRKSADENAKKKELDPIVRELNAEIAQWFTVWLQTPQVFASWITLRRKSPDFITKFGDLG